MCGIVGAGDLEKGLGLVDLVKSRGTRAWSVSMIDLDNLEFKAWNCNSTFSEFTRKDIEDFPVDSLKNPYFIFHLQSPTTTGFKHHPARKKVENKDGIIKHYYLWHNGMMDSAEHSKIEGRPWDTELLLNTLVTEEGIQWDALNQFKGSFACILLEEGENLFAFRNKIAPFHEDFHDYTIASVKWESSKPMEANNVYDITQERIIHRFDNKYNPFGV